MDRPGWNKLETAIRQGKVSAVVVWRIDRLGRTAKGLTALFDDLRERKVNLDRLFTACCVPRSPGAGRPECRNPSEAPGREKCGQTHFYGMRFATARQPRPRIDTQSRNQYGEGVSRPLPLMNRGTRMTRTFAGLVACWVILVASSQSRYLEAG